MAEMDPILGLNDAKSIEDLQKLGSVPCQDPLLLLQVSQIFLKTAKESELNGDQEKAYVCAHHMFPQILNFQFVVTFRERKKRSIKIIAILTILFGFLNENQFRPDQN